MRRTTRPVGARGDQPLYARVLRLRHLTPTSTQCFLLFEMMIAIAVLLALAELVPWWGVFALPAAVAAMVKVNDIIAGAIEPSPAMGTLGTRRDRRPVGGAALGISGTRPARGSAAVGRGAVGGRPHAGWTGKVSDPGHSRPGTDHVVARVPVLAQGDRGRRDAAADRSTGGPPGDRIADSTTLGLTNPMNALQAGGSVDSPVQRARQSGARRYD